MTQQLIEQMIEKRQHWIGPATSRMFLSDLQAIQQSLKEENATIRENLTVQEPKQVDTSEDVVEKIKSICIEYLGVDGGHHKQYALEEIMRTINPKRINEDYEKGIP